MDLAEKPDPKDNWEYVQATKDFVCVVSKKKFSTGECFLVIRYRYDYSTFICQDSTGTLIHLPEDISDEAVMCPWHKSSIGTATAV